MEWKTHTRESAPRRRGCHVRKSLSAHHSSWFCKVSAVPVEVVLQATVSTGGKEKTDAKPLDGDPAGVGVHPDLGAGRLESVAAQGASAAGAERSASGGDALRGAGALVRTEGVRCAGCGRPGALPASRNHGAIPSTGSPATTFSKPISVSRGRPAEERDRLDGLHDYDELRWWNFTEVAR